MRLKYRIDKDLIMRERGVGAFKRYEIWCPTRTFANTLMCEIKMKAKHENGHVSLGTTFRERKLKLKRNNNMTSQTVNGIIIMHWNARSLRNKSDELRKILEEKRVKIACIQEASLPQIETYHPKFSGFKMYHASRENRSGGGLVTLIHESLTVERIEGDITPEMEVAKLRIRISNNEAFTLYNVYVPGQGLRKEDLLTLLPTEEKTVIVGDFNSKHHTWNSGSSNRNGKILYEWLLGSNQILLNKNHTATFQSASTGTLSTLDLSIVTPGMWGKVVGWHVGQDLGSDHFPVFLELDAGNTQIRNNTTVHSRYKMKKADWDSFKDETTKIPTQDIATLEEIETIIINAADKSIPKQSGKAKHKYMNSWWNNELQELRRARNNARKKWKKTRIAVNRSQFNKCNAMLRKAILEAKRGSWREFVSSMNTNTPSSTVWKKFRATNGESSKRINAISQPNGNLLLDDDLKAEAFSKFLSDRSGRKISWPKQLSRDEQFLSCRMEHLYRCGTPMTSLSHWRS